MVPFAHRKLLAILLLTVMVGGTIATACVAPAGGVITQEVTVIVQQTQVVEKAVVVTATPAPVAEGSDMAADQVIQYVTRGFSRMDPASEGGFGRFVISHMFMPFFLRDYAYNLQPWLATGWDVNEDNTVYTIHIDPRAVWSDGSPVTAQEAIDYWTYGLDPEACPGCYLRDFSGFDLIKGVKEFAAGEAEAIAGLVAKDEKTLEVTLTGPDPIFPHRVALFDTGFVKMEDVEKFKVQLAGSDAMVFNATAETRVNGPFKIRVWDVDKQKHEIEQNPNWWGDKKPHITKIVAQPAPDENVSYIMWQNNEVDIAFLLGTLREKIRESDPDSMYLIPYPINLYYVFMQNMAPFDDINCRKALLHAVEWDKAIAAAWENTRNDRLMTGLLTPEMNCYKEGNWPEWGYDPAKAKEELAQCKYASDMPKIRISTGGQNPSYIRTAEVMVEQWKNNLGLTDVEIKPGWLDAWGQDADKVQVQRTSFGAIIPDSASFLSAHYDYYAGPDYMALDVPELKTLLDEVLLMQRDDPTYCSKIQEAEAGLLGQYIIVPMIWDIYEYSVKPWVKNFGTNVDNNWLTLLDIYIAKH